jgi:DNA-binding HxlR family transcriptional regulator
MEPNSYKGCPVQFTLQFLAGRWQAGILWNLRESPMRFGELKQLLPGITDKVLANELLFFSGKSMIEKKEFREFPRRTEYSLSPAGQSLLPIIQQIIVWGYDHLQDEKINNGMLMTPMEVMEGINILSATPLT